MSIIYKKHIDFPEAILMRNFEDDVDVYQIIESWEFLISNGQLTTNLKGVINDLRSCNLLMDFESFGKLMGYLKSKEELKSIKLAVISNTPGKIVFPIMGETQIKELMIKTFSTEIAAVKWIVG